MTAEAWPRPFEHAAWTKDAACRGMDPALFFPERGQNPTEAKRICAGCPVKAQCTQLADNNYERHGVWGGEVVADKRRGPRIYPLQHGTAGGYTAHLRLGEDACRPCLDAHNERMRINSYGRKVAS